MPEVGPDPLQKNDNVIALVSDKGGAGKTTLTANLAGQLAQGGLHVLVVELDLTGALQLSLGIADHPEGDKGASLVSAVKDGSPLRVVTDVRPGLDWVPGGSLVADLVILGLVDPVVDAAGGLPARFADVLAPVAANYDLVLLDCPPSNPWLQQMALGAARYVLVPVGADPSSWDSLRRIAPMVKLARDTNNPYITWLGTVLFAVPANATVMLRQTRKSLQAAAATVPLLDAFVRAVPRVAQDSRLQGRLAHEMAGESKVQSEQVREALKGKKRGQKMTFPARIPDASGLAQDYAQVAVEVCTRIGDHQNALAAGSAR